MAQAKAATPAEAAGEISLMKELKFNFVQFQQATTGQTQPQIIQTTDGQTLIYQPVQVENQGQPQQVI